MTFLNNQHLLVKFGEELCGRIINKDITIGKQLLILKSYTTIDNKPSNMVDINNSIGYCDIEIKEDGIYYTPNLLSIYDTIGYIFENEGRNILKVCGNSDFHTLFEISYFYVSFTNAGWELVNQLCKEM